MIQQIQYVISKGTNPYENIALEEYLLQRVSENTCILYLWQNKNTVVIGRNQNCWKECKVTALEEDGGYLARRLSGGGAVFHDLGNLNFTFLVRKVDYDVDRQLEVILTACRMLGIHAEKTGRNDITVDGKKFSGNAFYKTEESCYHHGTLLLCADLSRLSEYLNVTEDKLKAKGVSSVQSRVTNLSAFCPSITVDKMRETLIRAFEHVYGLKGQRLYPEDFSDKQLQNRRDFFASALWKYGKHMPFTTAYSQRFAWGDIDLHLRIKQGRIEAANLFSDGMDETFLMKIPEVLQDCPFQTEEMIERICWLKLEDNTQRQIAEDVKELFREQEL